MHRRHSFSPLSLCVRLARGMAALHLLDIFDARRPSEESPPEPGAGDVCASCTRATHANQLLSTSSELLVVVVASAVMILS